jgi:hypothetical protein
MSKSTWSRTDSAEDQYFERLHEYCRKEKVDPLDILERFGIESCTDSKATYGPGLQRGESPHFDDGSLLDPNRTSLLTGKSHSRVSLTSINSHFPIYCCRLLFASLGPYSPVSPELQRASSVAGRYLRGRKTWISGDNRRCLYPGTSGSKNEAVYVNQKGEKDFCPKVRG